jgi:hypothetical protein
MVKIVKSTHKQCGSKKYPPYFEIIQGIFKDFINLRIVTYGKENQTNRLSFLNKRYIKTETFGIGDIKRIIKALQQMVQRQEKRKDL